MTDHLPAAGATERKANDRPSTSPLECGARRVAITVAVTAALGAAISGCSLVAGVPATGPVEGPASAIGHIHGLGVDPDDGDLFVATHTGVYRHPAGEGGGISELEGPIGGNEQDTMGFTMVDGVMFGSGHPDPAGPDAELAALGLIVSTDQAETWDRVSLAGKADFHDIASVQNVDDGHDVYAYDGAAGAVRISSDSGKTWLTGANILARDLTFDTVSSTLYATLEDGVTLSTDHGITFTADTGAPALYLVEALNDGSGRLVGVDLDGSVWLGAAGEPWKVTGTVTGTVEALTYSNTPNPLLVVADARGVSTSDDFGTNWDTVLTAPE